MTSRPAEPPQARRAELLPFALAALLPLAVAAVAPGGEPAPLLLVVAAALSVGAIAVALVARPVRALAPALLYLLAIALLRETPGGATAGYTLLLVLPLLWVALRGSARELAVLLVAAGLVLAVPLVAFGAPRHPPGDWGRLALWMAVGPLVGFTVHALVCRTRAQALSEARARRLADAIISTAEALIVVTRPDGTVLRFNQACERATGYRASEIIGRVPCDTALVPADQAPEFHALLARLQAGRFPVAHENDWLTRDGERRTVAWSSTAVPSGTGALACLVATGIDVTEARRAQDAHHAAEARFRAAFRRAPIGVALVDADEPWRLRQVNPALCRLLGASEAALVGSDLARCLEPGHADAAREALAAAANQEAEGSTAELLLRHATGIGLWVHVSAAHARLDERPDQLVVHLQDVTERKRYEEQLRHLADHDALTGAFNRRRFGEELDRAITLARRYEESSALLTLDLDNFKEVNDAHGHAAGDELLVRVSAAIHERLRRSDVVGRIGGDEFAVLLPRLDGEAALAVARDLLRHLLAAATITREGTTMRATASIGITAIEPGTRATGEDLLIEADAAMYAAKEAGRNRAAVARPSSGRQARFRSRIQWAERIRAALADGGFALLAQPIRELRTGAVAGHELLLRLRADDGDLIPPSAFLDVAERAGHVADIDCWVVTEALRLLALDGERRLGAVEVNLSGTTIADAVAMRDITTRVAAAGDASRRLVFEITETAAIGKIGDARHAATDLRALGCRFALDDFGTGFGSFYYLKHLPFDLLKIDAEFVRELAGSRRDQLTVRAVVEIAHGLGKVTVAEGVEDEATVGLLRELDVDYAQGFHLGAPAPPDLPALERVRERLRAR